MLKKYSSLFILLYSIFLLILFSTSCNQSSSNANISNNTVTSPLSHPILVGAERFSEYLPLLQNKKVALVVNQSSLVKNVHLVDTLHNLRRILAHLSCQLTLLVSSSFADHATLAHFVNHAFKLFVSGQEHLNFHGMRPRAPGNATNARLDLRVILLV